jgi:hypothetical protein
MAKAKVALPRQWPGHRFSRPEIKALLTWLGEQQSTSGAPYIGERLALAMLEQKPAALKGVLDRLDDEAGHEMTDVILAAEESLRKRLELVMAAFSRIAIASGAIPWTEPDQPRGGAHVG